MKAVILAGGLGTRLAEETDTRPKPMVEIGGRPILWHILKLYSHFGINEFIVCLGYKGYVIKEYFSNYLLHMSDVRYDFRTNSVEVLQRDAEPWQVTLIDTGVGTMTGGRLKRVAHLIDEDFCFTYGDGLSNLDIAASIRFHKQHGKWATVTAVHPPGRFGTIETEDSRVVGFHEKPVGEGGLINGGFFVLSPKAIDLIDGDSAVWERDPMMRLTEHGQLQAFRHDGFWHPMDTLRDKRILEDLWNGGKPPWKLWT